MLWGKSDKSQPASGGLLLTASVALQIKMRHIFLVFFYRTPSLAAHFCPRKTIFLTEVEPPPGSTAQKSPRHARRRCCRRRRKFRAGLF
jgi:hypothetical protein